ncbi:MAG: M20/M25/M40 family metallo-hydrolase, partial [Solirubrobacteraceae bacterium]
LQPQDADVACVLEGEFASPPMEKGEGTEWLLRHARDAAGQLGVELRDIATGGGSDGNRIAAAGIPVLDALGPVGGRAHSTEEYIEIPSIAIRGAILAAMIASISSERGGPADRGS